ncbi:UDP-N-acetylmuramoyl-L-alanine--D-glutamate ligase [Vreelandella populi]|uniref:UDP-N-acetylmuramoylalanine--D-glutamate ligase n=1 Tax=Vreelandella populi TaxID=2498858 RepID=A0A3S0WIV4_9GAMM|nr:UDP-N-acetylmuramoyl-L-alanine--D-glutamate ligase [Halomonas populi]RUR42582.1 UDP-N-acetylmuramoyl-L-alanine--D-glutamate ligase [Halomonas populi]RUR45815.1 UDP-N-acetylmuramoyl-L-alanine--D-glutamate ligase [Halomonas populi]
MVRVPSGMTVVVGLGLSGRAICRHLARTGKPFIVADTRREPPGLETLYADYPGVEVYCGPLDELDFTDAYEVVLSPGVDPGSPGLKGLAERINPQTNEPVLIGETALFTRINQVPVAAITGSNAKSTVTTLLGEMAKASGLRVAVGGNLGTPALDLLADEPEAELYILELSSFQLETTPALGAKAAAFLNLSEDHLDRHGDMQAYRMAKQRIFTQAQYAIVNQDEPLTWPVHAGPEVIPFSSNPSTEDGWGLVWKGGELILMHGQTAWVSASELSIAGQHNYMNALAALAMGQALGFDASAMVKALKAFTGLAHRSETIAHINGVTWVNDSKGTNVGATLAAINGLGATLKGRLVWLGGGVGKGADFSPLAMPLANCAREALVFGEDRERISQALTSHVTVRQVNDLTQAMEAAFAIAKPGDCVLLSPACASFDQFSDYQARGEAFRCWVENKAAEMPQ